ncbi:MAG: PspC domain-containing protein [Methanohalobium sp.]|uniref:PspC domain-containing protein n=1 Tax=Methanohalobium sp. TaxID=2837493 RepID=UPI00397DB0B3
MDENKEKNGREKLTKSKKERMLAGVCGGIAEYFDVDPTLIRVAFVILALANGLGILLYIILAIVMPEPKDKDKATTEQNTTGEPAADEYSKDESFTKTKSPGNRSHTDRNVWLGIILIILGVFLIVDRFNIFWWLGWDVLWPSILILIGLWILVRIRR